MSAEYVILIIGFVFGFYMAWNIGANDVANSMASAVGAKAITIRQAVFIAGILNIVGATFIGSHVTNTIRKGIVSTEVMSDPHVALAGALAALLAAALWVSFATWRSLPGFDDPFHRRGHDRLWYYGGGLFRDQLGKTGGSRSELGHITCFQPRYRLCYVQGDCQGHSFKRCRIRTIHTVLALFYRSSTSLWWFFRFFLKPPSAKNFPYQRPWP